MSFVLLKNRNGEYTVSKLSFDSGIDAIGAEDGREPDATIGNLEFLDPGVVIAGLAESCGINDEESANLLNGSCKISDLAPLSYSILVKESEKVIHGDYYHYKLQNGVVIFGLNETHQVVKSMELEFDVEVILNQNVLSAIRTNSRGKRKRTKKGEDTHVCTIKVGNVEHEIHLTEHVVKCRFPHKFCMHVSHSSSKILSLGHFVLDTRILPLTKQS
ncbi:hypothetical protein BEWA_054500 [Theileria equi strain WA]|uniref:Uncharacterized protein n=1 Tax=Theileria equi strain WA TaxID=1537102 RepID=L1LDP2_THEEQ|nr:hypothetical protein BEWA_054500 [Theileria equi strain WA]EKX73394.1 hypothetical protein BEWA_054500 [Theileria equi strain WA]|eukprot:XP_004832846.1 hypothetical protein BEWA_054500 [Theileria equi strain WA]